MQTTQADERRRSEARVAALAAAIHAGPSAPGDVADAELFASAPQRRSIPAATLAFGVLAVGSIAAMIVVFSGSSTTAGAPLARSASGTSAAPLELAALTHDRAPDSLVVRGVVRNPAAGAGLPQLTAVVQLFDRDGEIVGNGRAAVEKPTLAPGAETPFIVAIPARADVVRYRVSFRRADDASIVPHVDRRDGMMAQSQ